MYLFDKKIDPSCAYCKFGKLSSNHDKILCNKNGIKLFSDSCKFFKYEPLKRVPTRHKSLPKYSNDDFKL